MTSKDSGKNTKLDLLGLGFVRRQRGGRERESEERQRPEPQSSSYHQTNLSTQLVGHDVEWHPPTSPWLFHISLCTG